MDDRLLVADEEEGMLGVEEARNRDWATYCAAELISFERIDCLYAVDVTEVVGCIEVAVAEKLK